MAILSNTGIVTNNEVYFDYSGQGEAKGVGVIAYIDYVAGEGDTLSVKFKYNETRLTEDYYYNIYYDGTVIKITEYSFNGTGKYRIAIPVSLNEDSIILEFIGLVGGTINVDFSVDGAYR